MSYQDVQTYINGQHVLQLYENVESAREPKFVKMANAKRYLEHGIKKTQVLRKRSKSYRNKVDWTMSGYFRTIEVGNANETLKALTRESEALLLKYAASVSYLMTKAKSFMTLRNDSERVLTLFLTKEIYDLYKV